MFGHTLSSSSSAIFLIWLLAMCRTSRFGKIGNTVVELFTECFCEPLSTLLEAVLLGFVKSDWRPYFWFLFWPDKLRTRS